MRTPSITTIILYKGEGKAFRAQFFYYVKVLFALTAKTLFFIYGLGGGQNKLLSG